MSEARAAQTMMREPLAHSARLLFGVFAAPFAWVVQLAVSFALAATSCFSGGVAKTGARVSGASQTAMVVVAIVYGVKAGRGEWAEYPFLGRLARRILKLGPGGAPL